VHRFFTVSPRFPSILVVDDDPTTREALAELLEDEGYPVATAGSASEAMTAIERERPGLILSDVRMPGGDGMELITRVRASSDFAHTPILLVSALEDHDQRIAALDLGANDFIAKPVDPRELLARVRVQLRQIRREGELERHAMTDPLTGVLNHRGLHALLRRERERAIRTRQPLSVLLIDIDRFKQVNDKHGHQTGDTLLRQIAASLVRAVRAVDDVGRIGGDEFVVVLPGADAAAAATLCMRLRALRPRLATAEGELAVSLSIGAATLDGDESIETLLDRADRRMYRLKRTGEMPVVPRS
jgi:diguanylate cyclase (GGDEF)-like protein